MKKIITSMALGLLTVAGLFAQNTGKPSEGTVNVVGTASQVLTPDRVVIQIIVENRAKTAKEAQKLTSESVSKVLSYLKTKESIKTVETNYISLRPQRVDYNREEYEYVAFQNIAFVLINIGDYQNVIIDLLDRGMNGIGQVVFESSKRKEAEEKLLADAVKNAREKAKYLATQVNKEVGEAVYISDHIQSSGQRPLFMDGIQMKSEAVIAPGELKVSAEVNVTFELK